MSGKPIQIPGRNIHGDKAHTVVTVSNQWHEPVLQIHGGSVQEKTNGDFLLVAKHPTATDIEHDSSYSAYLEGTGLRYEGMTLRSVYLSGAIFTAGYWPEGSNPEEDAEVCTACDAPHPILDFTPPRQDWKAGRYFLTVKFVDVKSQ